MLRAVAVTGLSIVVIGFAGCSGGLSPAEQGVRDGVFHINNASEPENLDPHTVTGVPEHFILSALFEGLVNLAADGVTIVPAVAESWEMSEDGLTYTFKLRDNAKWSDGSPVTAADFLYAWERILTPALGSDYASMLYVMKNARPFHESKIDDFSLVGAKAIDPLNLEVTLEYPAPYFLSMHSHYTWFPLQEKAVEAHGGMTERGTKWTQPGNLVSNGPFMLTDWEPDRIIITKRNPHYWDNVILNEIHFHPVNDLLTEERNFRSGELHMTYDLPLSKFRSYEKDDSGVLRVFPYYGTYYYMLNVTKKPLDDVRVRRALSLATDRKRLCDYVIVSGEKPAHAFSPPDPNGFAATTRLEFDPNAARKLLAEAGYPDGKGFPPVELLYNTQENHRTIAETIQQMWNEELNIQVELVNQDWKVYLATRRNLDYNVARAGWIGDYVEPINFLECMETGNGNNNTGWSSAEYDALLAKARRAPTNEERYALYQQAEEILNAEMPILPIYQYVRRMLVRPEVKGWVPNLIDHRFYQGMSLEAAN